MKGNNMKNRSVFQIAIDIILAAAAAALCFGTKFVFHACGAKEDGSFMACHWAEQAVLAFGIAILIMAVLRLIFSNSGVKTGLSLAIIPSAIIAAMIPNVFINLCMMKDMRCHSVMRPAVIICAAVIAALAAAGIFADSKKTEKK